MDHSVPAAACKAPILMLAALTLSLLCASCSAQGDDSALSDAQLNRKKLVAEMDRTKLRYSSRAVRVVASELINIPAHVGSLDGAKVAASAPDLDFGVIPLEPRFFNKPEREGLPEGLWSSWGQGTFHDPTGKLYAAVGNHIYYDARLHIVEYDASTREISISPELNSAIGRTAEDFGDGKIHGHLDFAPWPQLKFMTYWCAYPEPTHEQFEQGYNGGKLLSYDVRTREVRDLGEPMRRVSWPYHKMDTTRGLMFGVGSLNEFLCYDVRKQRPLWAGFAPDGMKWHDRNMIVDEQTGCAYSSNLDGSDPEVHMLKYDASSNRITRMSSTVPANAVSKEKAQVRAHTWRKSLDGWFMMISRNGELFRFYPDQDKVEDLGLCWPAAPERLYTTSMAVSTDDRFVYYVPGAHGSSHLIGTPVVQLNTKTGERKALAFLYPALYERYGYIPSGVFSINIDITGSTLYIVTNGAFTRFDPAGGDVFGDPAIIALHIPASERV